MAPLSAPAIRTAVRELRAVLYARCRYLLSRVTAHYHACDVPETRPHGTPMIVSRLRLLSSTKCAMAGTDASCYQGHRPGTSKHKNKPVGSPESQSKISEGVGGPRAGASGAMRAPTTRRRKTSRGCAIGTRCKGSPRPSRSSRCRCRSCAQASRPICSALGPALVGLGCLRNGRGCCTNPAAWVLPWRGVGHRAG